jgi:hypothetical protein
MSPCKLQRAAKRISFKNQFDTPDMLAKITSLEHNCIQIYPPAPI